MSLPDGVTPGPWESYFNGKTYRVRRHAECDGDFRVVAECGENEANSVAIRAFPAMYEFCERVLKSSSVVHRDTEWIAKEAAELIRLARVEVPHE